MTPPTARPHWVVRVLHDRTVQIGLAIWILFSAAIPYLAQGVVPFDQPMFAASARRAFGGFHLSVLRRPRYGEGLSDAAHRQCLGAFLGLHVIWPHVTG